MPCALCPTQHVYSNGPITPAPRSLSQVVLVDAPCSSSGTLRRHPGLRWSGRWSGGVRIADDADSSGDDLTTLQRRLLRQALALVRPGGRLVYATCSLQPEENDLVADAFEATAAPDDASLPSVRRVEPWAFEEGAAGRDHQQPHRCTLWPHRHGTDGFFIARWRVA